MVAVLVWTMMFAAEAQTVPAEKKPARIAGKVVNAKTGEPLRKAAVLAYKEERGRGQTFSTTTDAEGKFTLDRIEDGTYRLTAQRNGFLSTQYSLSGRRGSSTPVQVAAGEDVTGIDFKMIPHGVASGKVLDADGDPMMHAMVTISRISNLGGKRRLQQVNGGTTNDLGEFRFFELEAGKYVVQASHSFRRGGLDGSSQTREAYIPTYYPGAADFSGASVVELDSGQEAAGLVIQMRRSPVFRVSGRVVNLPANVRAQSVNIMLGQQGAEMRGRGQGSSVRADGTFQLSPLPPGTYQLTAIRSDRRPIVIGKQLLTIGTADVEDVIFPLSEPVRLTGVVKFDEPPAERPRRMELYLESMEPAMFGEAGGTVKEDGTFAIEQVSRERFRVNLSDLPAGYFIAGMRSGNQDISAVGLDLSSAGSVVDLELILSNKAGTVEGTVKDGDRPAGDRTVTLVPEPFLPFRTDLIRRYGTTAGGTFTLKTVAPGDYRVYAWDEIARDLYTDPDFLKKHEAASVKVSVKAGGTERLELKTIRLEEKKQ